MSLLTQFYPGPGGGGGGTSGGVASAMSPGGIVATASTYVMATGPNGNIPSSGNFLPMVVSTPGGVNGWPTGWSARVIIYSVPDGDVFRDVGAPTLANTRIACVGSPTIVGDDVIFVNCEWTGYSSYGVDIDFNAVNIIGLNVVSGQGGLATFTFTGNALTLQKCRFETRLNTITISLTGITSVTDSVFIVNTGQTYNFNASNFSSSAVDSVLVSFAANGSTGGTINIAGTNAAPGASGTAAKATLIANGVTVTTN